MTIRLARLLHSARLVRPFKPPTVTNHIPIRTMAAGPDVPRIMELVNSDETVISPERAILYALGVGAKRNEVREFCVLTKQRD